ncbi:hypothetical protein SH449x_003455 [Pirellulaceae bacterium SH449]
MDYRKQSMGDRSASIVVLKYVMFSSVVILHGPSWAKEFDIEAYEQARKHSIFPLEYTMSATELTTRSNGIKIENAVTYISKHGRKRLNLTVVDSSNDQSRVGYSVSAIKTESTYASAQRFPDKPDYFLDRVTNSGEDAEQSFSSVLPIFAPYFIDRTDILKILQDDQTRISDAREVDVDGRRQIQLRWSEILNDPAGPVTRVGEMLLDIENYMALTRADFSIGLVGKPPVRTHSIRIEYQKSNGFFVPGMLEERIVFLSENAWKEIRFDKIQFDTSPVSDDVFDLANIGYKDPSRSLSFRLWIYFIGFALVFLLFVLRKRQA